MFCQWEEKDIKGGLRIVYPSSTEVWMIGYDAVTTVKKELPIVTGITAFDFGNNETYTPLFNTPCNSCQFIYVEIFLFKKEC